MMFQLVNNGIKRMDGNIIIFYITIFILTLRLVGF